MGTDSSPEVDIGRDWKPVETPSGLRFRGIKSRTELQGDVRELAKIARTDPLTKLLNRRGVEEQYKLVRRTEERFMGGVHDILIALDMIGMKHLNNTLGPKQTDGVIQAAASYLQGKIQRPTDLACRWGGDEFLLVFSGATPEFAEKIITDINSNLPENVHFNIAYQAVHKREDPVIAMNEIMNRMEEVKKLGGVDESGRSIGNGVAVQIDGRDLRQINV
jgi:diguanylate cyclase (GGDEF)-like protein